jgi:hypothetical protein
LVGGDEAEAAAGSDLVKEEFDFQVEDGDEGEPAATLLPPRGTWRPQSTAAEELTIPAWEVLRARYGRATSSRTRTTTRARRR